MSVFRVPTKLRPTPPLNVRPNACKETELRSRPRNMLPASLTASTRTSSASLQEVLARLAQAATTALLPLAPQVPRRQLALTLRPALAVRLALILPLPDFLANLLLASAENAASSASSSASAASASASGGAGNLQVGFSTAGILGLLMAALAL